MIPSKLNPTSDQTNTTNTNITTAKTAPDPIADLEIINDLQESTLASIHHDDVQDASCVVSTSAPGSQESSADMEKDPPKAILSPKDIAPFSYSEQSESTSKYHTATPLPFEIHTQALDRRACMTKLPKLFKMDKWIDSVSN